jgi:Tfp pilus assembly protein PilO
VALYAEAGFLDIFKNFNINDFGNWFVSNFIWVIISLAVVFVIYLFWFFYIK